MSRYWPAGFRPGRPRAFRSTAACMCRARPLPRSSSTNTARRGSAPRNWRERQKNRRDRWRSSTAAPTRSTTRTASPVPSACPAPSWSTAFTNWCRRPTPLSSSIAAGARAASSAPRHLIDAGVPNRVVSLKDGTMAWHLAGLDVVTGADRRAPEVSAAGVAAARQRAEAVARRYGVPAIDRATLAGGGARPTGAHSTCSMSATRPSTAPGICRAR